MTTARGSDPERALQDFISDMEQLCSGAKSMLNYIHISAVFSASAKVLVTALGNRNFHSVQQAAHHGVAAFLCDMSHLLHPMLTETAARNVSSILWASAKIGVRPDCLAFVADLTDRFLYLTRRPTATERPNAQDVSNVLWALATMKHTTTSSASVVDACCVQFSSLLRTPEAAKQPTAQVCANVLWALASPEHTPKDETFVGLCCEHVSLLIKSSDAAQQPTAPGCANTL